MKMVLFKQPIFVRVFKAALILTAILLLGLSWRLIFQEDSKLSKPNFAKFATAHDCMAQDLTAGELNQIVVEMVNPEMKGSSIKSDILPRVIASLPKAIRQSLLSHHIKISTDKVKNNGRKDLTNFEKRFDPIASPHASIEVSDRHEKILYLAADSIQDSKSENADSDEHTIGRVINETLLPSAIWYATEVLWNRESPDEVFNDTQTSIRSVWIGIKSQFASLISISPEEEEYYHRELDSGGRHSSLFTSRVLTLFTTNFYCSSETYDRLTRSNPAASDYFHKYMMCALGRPRHMKEETYLKHCPS